MSGDVQRAVGFLAVGTIGLLVPAFTGGSDVWTAWILAVVPFLAVTVLALSTRHGPVFELFAGPRDRETGRLYGLASFAFAAAGLAAIRVGAGLSAAGFLASIFVFTTGNLGQALTERRSKDPVTATTGFALTGAIGGVGRGRAAGALGASTPTIPVATFAVASGALLGALVRSLLTRSDSALVVLAIGLLVWFLLPLSAGAGGPDAGRVAIGLALTVGLGYLAFALGTASVTGMVTGMLLALFTVVLGGYGWFVLLVTFFGLGGLSSKYRYAEKLELGIAQDDDGARGGGNVLANSAVALLAVVAYASFEHAGLESALFRYAFAGAVAAALADTFSSEFGGLYEDPRLITTFEPVIAGTDGGVTWQGLLAGTVGAAVIAGLGAVFFEYGPIVAVAIATTGVVGMVVDSLLGATLEGAVLGNQSVNLLATLSAGLLAAAVAVAL